MPATPTPPKLALDPPAETVVELDDTLLEQVITASRTSPRKRIILPLHDGPDARLHRMMNAIQPGSYIRPHRHAHPPKDETLVMLRGTLKVLLFDEDGTVTGTSVISASAPRFGIDMAAGVIHTFVALEPDSVMYEAKVGPYEKPSDQDFMPWAPGEGTPEAEELVRLWSSDT